MSLVISPKSLRTCTLSFVCKPIRKEPHRYTHRAPSHEYLKIWKEQKIDYLEQLERKNISLFPKLLENIFKVETTLKVQGFAPFVHAMPAGAHLLRSCYRSFSSEQDPFFQQLRPSPTISWNEAIKNIPQREARLEKPHFLSMSYALTSSIRHLESAASFGFINHFGNEQNGFLLREYELFLSSSLKNQNHVYTYFREKGWKLIRLYSRMRVGDFLILGVPQEKLSRWVYDSKPYNVPTGNHLKTTLRQPRNYLNHLLKEGHQATLLLCKETLRASSGLKILKANDGDLVNAYCKGIVFKPLQEIALYQQMLKPAPTEIEKEEEEKRKVLDRQLISLLQELREAIVEPKRFFAAMAMPTEDFPLVDFAPLPF